MINGNIRTQKRERSTRFFVQGLINGLGLKHNEDGNICDRDNVAVIYLREGSNASAPVYDLWYGNIQTLTAMVSNVRRTVHKVHMLDASGQARIKWYDNIQNASDSHKQYHGKLAFTLSVIEKEGLNKTVDCAQIVLAVRMVLDELNDCYLLIAADCKFVEEQQKKITAHNKKLANAKNEEERQRIGPHQKAIRPHHDALKERLLFV